jgi:hypothetical protein
MILDFVIQHLLSSYTITIMEPGLPKATNHVPVQWKANEDGKTLRKCCKV